jgi:N-acetylneuraminic acid mutarotase
VLQVTDNEGGNVTDTIAVTVTNKSPDVYPGGPYKTKINRPLYFIGSAFDDGSIVLYEWDFENDGIYDWSSESIGRTINTYLSAGDFTAVFRTTDDDGNIVIATVDVSVTNDSPTVDPGGPYTASINDTLVFAGVAYDDGTVVLREWDLDGDGVFEWNLDSTDRVTHAYSVVGTHTATFRAVDEDANSGTVEVEVVITNNDPVIIPGGPYGASINSTVYFYGSAEDDGSIILYQWDLDGDGKFEWSSEGTTGATNIWSTVGTYAAFLRAYDEDDNSSTAVVDVVITNNKPVIQLNGPYRVSVNDGFIAHYAVSDDGRAVYYEWDFDGDGTFDWSRSGTGAALFRYESAGAYQAALRATDEDGNTGIATVDVFVTDQTPTVTSGGPYTVESHEPLTLWGTAIDDGRIVSYQWDFYGDGIIDWSSTSTGVATHVYRKAGIFQPKFFAIDEDGNIATVSDRVTVENHADSWFTGAPMPTPRHSLAAGVINRQLYVVGGLSHSRRTGALEIYVPSTDSWTSGPSLPVRRSGHAAGVIDGKLYVVGGVPHGDIISNRLDIYDPELNRWGLYSWLPTARRYLAVGIYKKKLYAIGGEDINGYSDMVEIYDPSARTWTTGPPMLTKKIFHAVGVIADKLYVVGGKDSTSLNTLEILDLNRNQWTTGSPMPTARYGLATSVVDGKLFAIGGHGGANIVEVYDPATNTWTSGPPMPTPRSGLAAGTIGGLIHAVGGVVAGVDDNSLEILDW